MGGNSKRLARIILVLTLCFTALSFAATAANASTSTDEAKFVSLINHERSSRGIRTLTVYGDLVAVARDHSADMAAKGTIWHASGTPYKVSGWTVYGENVGMGATVSDLHDAFMNSPEHRDNILDREFNQIGVGIAVKNGTIYVTEIFVQRQSKKTTTTKPVASKTTSSTTRTSSAPRTASASAPAPRPVARRPVAKPAVATPTTVNVLVQLVGLDAHSVDTATGQALGL
ncbi:MAG: CAP domain-containing protein [Actinobacteria bacterium]|nr:CAP domain-containing protein [Actinomycetota bacterium]